MTTPPHLLPNAHETLDLIGKLYAEGKALAFFQAEANESIERIKKTIGEEPECKGIAGNISFGQAVEEVVNRLRRELAEARAECEKLKSASNGEALTNGRQLA
jgi:hypothetical protein